MIRIIRFIIVISVIFSLGVLAYLNSNNVQFDYLLAKTELPLSILLLFCFLAGVLVSAFALIGLVLAQKLKINKLTSSVHH